jgi:bifunctional DNA-binding transcriptional regulator/antitoxin component of YhaV-PrlF toxin-antitoxin module
MKIKTCSVDPVGRLIIPKSLRTSLGILGRAKVRLELVGDHAEISLATTPAGTARRQNGRLVHAAPLPADWDSGDAVLQARERRTIR